MRCIFHSPVKTDILVIPLFLTFCEADGTKALALLHARSKRVAIAAYFTIGTVCCLLLLSIMYNTVC